ncbi:MAG: hypothetical protein KF788_04380 [Piscinibacter sp.]|nr:hypothetical protein [Piscinibacter sp.]
MTHDDDEAVPHDRWLREALRHAPDADAAPPPRVNDAILRMGRAAVAPRPVPAPPAPPTLDERLAAVWDWLARPPVAAGFASVMVATVVGLMWWGRPIEEALPPPETVSAAPEAATPADGRRAGSAEAESVDARSRQVAPTTSLGEARAPKQAPPPVAAAAPPAPAEPAARKAAAPPPPVAPAVVPAPAPAAAPARDASAEQKRSAATPSEELRLRGSPLERREAAVAPSAAPPAPPPPATNATAPGTVGAAGAAAADAAAPGPAGALSGLRARAAVGTIETAGLSNLRFEIPRRQQDWTWQRDDGPARPVDEATMNWIAQADRTARPHWNPGPAAGEGATATLRFTRDGVVRAILRVGPRGLRLDRGGKTESAELSSAQAASLLAALDALGP